MTNPISEAPRHIRAPKRITARMSARVTQISVLLAQGYTVRDAGRELGLTIDQADETARRFGLRCQQGALAEAKSMAGQAGNAARWGA